MSASMSRTRWLISASAMPRLLITVVLPSRGDGLVTTRTLGRSPFSPENRMEVIVDRNASAMTECFWFQVTISREFVGSKLPVNSVVKRAGFALLDGLLGFDDAGSARIAGSALADGMTPSSR